MKKILIISMLGLFLWQCSQRERVPAAQTNFIMETTISGTIDTLKMTYPDADPFRIERGVKQAAGLWHQDDGTPIEFTAFCKENFIASDEELKNVFLKLSKDFESIYGNFNKMTLELLEPLHLDIGPIYKIDRMFGAYDPSAHLNDDLFNNKIAFVVSLNFPYYSLEEKTKLGPDWNRLQWAYARMGDMFTARVPASFQQHYSEVSTNSDIYISEYNIYAGKLLDSAGNTLFPADLKLLSHWNLRDEIKSNYAGADGLKKQELIYEVMKRIVSQEIPEKVINDSAFTWNPYTNKVYRFGDEVTFTPEGAVRYQHILDNFHALHDMDPFYPVLNTYIKRKFDGEMEVTQPAAEKLFISVVSSPLYKEMGKLIANRLGRDLKPFDIWYDGFKTRSGIDESKLDAITEQKYPNSEAFKEDLPNILTRLGFEQKEANFIASWVAVDPARGSGHAWGAAMKSMKSHLRTRIPKGGMNYKGYNIAVHEFGHNVEQTISMHDVDYYMLNGVPNTAFTEALAFLFQKQDLYLLGMESTDPGKENLDVLDHFWSVYEIMGVSLVDMNIWKWMYAHPEATADELKEAVIGISKDIWNKYYADVFGMKDQTILAVYSHMVSYPLYLSAYSYGELIDFQIAEYLKGRNFAREVQRMYSIGRVTPDEWMQLAVGSPVSADPLLKAAEKALKNVK